MILFHINLINLLIKFCPQDVVVLKEWPYILCGDQHHLTLRTDAFQSHNCLTILDNVIKTDDTILHHSTHGYAVELRRWWRFEFKWGHCRVWLQGSQFKLTTDHDIYVVWRCILTVHHLISIVSFVETVFTDSFSLMWRH